MKFDLFLLCVVFAAFIPLLVLGIALTITRRNRERSEKPPQTEKLLRPPGFSLSLRLDRTVDAILSKIVWACFFCCFAGIAALTLANLLAQNAPASWLLLFTVIFAGFVIPGAFFSLLAFRGFREGENIRLGLRGEQAVAEALNEAASVGFRSFHDLPGGETWNIDHVAVGTRGLFLIETKARRRLKNWKGLPEHEVIYDGEKLQFPRGPDSRPIEQAKRNAKWLSNYLEKKTGEPVRVEPLVILPGWFVKITAKGNSAVKVMNANYLVKFLQGQNEIVAPSQVRRIITALDEKCRDLEF